MAIVEVCWKFAQDVESYLSIAASISLSTESIMQLSFSILICLAVTALAGAQAAPIWFGFSQILDNLPVADCNGANFASCNTTIISTVAETLSLNASSVQSVSFTKVKALYFGSSKVQVNQTKVSYEVATESATETFDSLTNTLVAAINAGAFTTTMRSFAGFNALADATALSQANGGTLTASDRLAPRSASSQLTGAEISGLVIGIVLFLVLLGVFVAFMLQCKQSEADHIATNARPVSTKETV